MFRLQWILHIGVSQLAENWLTEEFMKREILSRPSLVHCTWKDSQFNFILFAKLQFTIGIIYGVVTWVLKCHPVVRWVVAVAEAVLCVQGSDKLYPNKE